MFDKSQCETNNDNNNNNNNKNKNNNNNNNYNNNNNRLLVYAGYVRRFALSDIQTLPHLRFQWLLFVMISASCCCMQ